MASKTLGRIACPISCGFDAAHVKLKTDKAEGKTAFPYVHCPSCGCQLHTKTEEQAEHLLKRTRAEKLAAPERDTHEGEGEKTGERTHPAPEAQNSPPVATPARTSRFSFGGML